MIWDVNYQAILTFLYMLFTMHMMSKKEYRVLSIALLNLFVAIFMMAMVTENLLRVGIFMTWLIQLMSSRVKLKNDTI